MTDKAQLISTLRDELHRWELLVQGLSEEQILTPLTPSRWTIQDLMAHLHAWQQRTIARLEAGLHDREPVFPQWGQGLDADDDAQLDKINEWIYEANRHLSWPTVYQNWRSGFLRVIELAEAIPERDLLEPGRYTWLRGKPLAFILTATYEHHHVDHGKRLLDWLHRHGVATPG